MNERLSRFLRLGALVAAVCGFPGLAQAQISPAGPAVEVLPGGGWRVLQPTSIGAIARSNNSSVTPVTPSSPPMAPISRTGVAGTDGITVTDSWRMQTPLGAVDVNTDRMATWAVLGMAIARGIATRNPMTVMSGVAGIISEARVKPDSSGTGLVRDVGTPAQVHDCQLWTFGGASDCNAGAALSRGIDLMNKSKTYCGTNEAGDPVYWTYTGSLGALVPSGAAYDAAVLQSCTAKNNPVVSQGYMGNAAVFGAGIMRTKDCPEYHDPINGGMAQGTPDSEGNCPTGAYSKASLDQAAAALAKIAEARARGTTDPSGSTSGSTSDAPSDVGQGLVDQIINGARDNGVTIGDPGQTPITQNTGPAEKSGSPTVSTTQNSDGSMSSTTVTPKISITYTPTTITYNTSSTTQTTKDGQTTTTTTTTPKTDNGGSSDTPGLCDLFPMISACAKLGDPGDTPEMDTDKYDFNGITPVDFTDGSGCPPPITVSTKWIPITLSFDPLCDQAVKLKPLVILLGWMGALYAFAGGFKV